METEGVNKYGPIVVTVYHRPQSRIFIAVYQWRGTIWPLSKLGSFQKPGVSALFSEASIPVSSTAPAPWAPYWQSGVKYLPLLLMGYT